MPSFNLIRDPWIPVITRSRQRRTIRPAELTRDLASDPIVEIGWPRADLRAATLEFLIGLLTTACVPEGDDDWRGWWDDPPSPEDLAARFEPYASAFDPDGDGPRFLQDRGDLGDELSSVAGLIIDQPGANTEKNNADLFVKRGQVGVLARSTAAIVLYALQAFAPSGGAGHRTSLRGGGPLVTLVVPPKEDDDHAALWHRLWLNVVSLYDPFEHGEPLDEPARAFPWLADTRVSDKTGVLTTGADVHPVQCFWGMPRRIALVFEENVEGLPCDLTGRVDDVIVRSYRTRPYGVNYDAVAHPLTPYYRVKPGASEWLPVHPQPGGIAYRNWLGFVQEPKTGLRRPALCVTVARQRLRSSARLSLLGYDMDNMKARGFVEAEMPLFSPSEIGKREKLDTLAERMVEGASEVAGLLLSQIKAATGDAGGGLDLIRETFFKATENAFFEHLATGFAAIEAAPDGEEHPDLLIKPGMTWLERTLAPVALDTFGRHVKPEAAVMNGDLKAIRRAVDAKAILGAGLKGYGPSGRSIIKALTGADAAPPARKSRKGSRS
jgi:CRISPR system Cascade subunit CasA